MVYLKYSCIVEICYCVRCQLYIAQRQYLRHISDKERKTERQREADNETIVNMMKQISLRSSIKHLNVFMTNDSTANCLNVIPPENVLLLTHAGITSYSWITSCWFISHNEIIISSVMTEFLRLSCIFICLFRFFCLPLLLSFTWFRILLWLVIIYICFILLGCFPHTMIPYSDGSQCADCIKRNRTPQWVSEIKSLISFSRRL